MDGNDGLAARVGRLEAVCEGLRQDLFDIQVSAQPAASSREGDNRGPILLDRRSGSGHSATGASHEEVLAEWVRLFEKELDHVRRKADACEKFGERLQARVDKLDGGSAVDVEELAEMLLASFRSLQAEVRSLAAGTATGSSTLDSAAAAAGNILQGTQRQQRSKDVVQQFKVEKEGLERMVRVEQSVASVVNRLGLIETELAGEGDSGSQGEQMKAAVGSRDHSGSGKDPRRLMARLQQLEGDIEEFLEPCRRHGLSLRAIEDTAEKVEELQQILATVPTASAMKQSAEAVRDLQATARDVSGPVSVWDAQIFRQGLEAVQEGMEALARQRGNDVRLMNACLEEVYMRVERDLPKDGGMSMSTALDDMRAKVGDLSARLNNLSDVQLGEMESRSRYEAREAAKSADSCRKEVEELKDVVQRSLERSGDAEVRLRTLHEAMEKSIATDRSQDNEAQDVRREVSKLRKEVTELSARHREGAGLEVDARLAAMRADLESQLEGLQREAGRAAEALRGEVQNMRRQTYDQQSAGPTAILNEDVQRLGRDVQHQRQEQARADVELRERTARTERELRAEIRATQGLVLEVAEQIRAGGPGGGGFAPRGAGATLMRRIGDVSGDGTATIGAVSTAYDDAGSVSAVGEDAVVWSVPGIRARARRGDARPLVSQPFAVPGFQGGPMLKLKLFPLGSKKRTQAGCCSLYVSGPEGAHLKFLLRLGPEEHGPLECFFDRPDKDTGRHDFCILEDALEADGSALVRLTVIKVAPALEAAPGTTIRSF